MTRTREITPIARRYGSRDVDDPIPLSNGYAAWGQYLRMWECY